MLDKVIGALHSFILSQVCYVEGHDLERKVTYPHFLYCKRCGKEHLKPTDYESIIDREATRWQGM